MTVFELGKKLVEKLEKGGDLDFITDSRLINEKACNIPHNRYLIDRNRDATEEEIQKALIYAEKRLNGFPLQYILGEWEFLSHKFYVGDGVLIPRPETEELVDHVIEYMSHIEKPVVLDLCSGSGCIGISIKHIRDDADVYLVEKSEKAIPYLEKNKIENGFGNRIVSIGYDILKGPSEIFPEADVIVSNPPYIMTEELKTLQKEVLHEPEMALDGGFDGLIFYRCLASDWFSKMKSGGIIAVECGENQARVIESMLSKYACKTEVINDFYGVERFVFAVKE